MEPFAELRTPVESSRPPRAIGAAARPSPTRPRRERERALAAWLRRHHGVVTLAELFALGFSAGQIHTLVQHGTLIRRFHGVYMSGHHRPTPPARHLAAVRAGGSHAGLVRWSAAYHRGGLRFAPDQIEVGIPSDRGVRHRSGVHFARLATLAPSDLELVDGVPTTTWQRTILDAAAITRRGSDYLALRRMMRSAAVQERDLMGRLRHHVDEERPFRGCRILTTVLNELAPNTGVRRSELEDAFLDFCTEFGLPQPATNALVDGAEVDGLYGIERVIIELDTFDYHGDPAAFEADRLRDARLVALGYVVIRITARRLRHEAPALAEQLRAVLAARRG